mgnify:CR=1 FL=1
MDEDTCMVDMARYFLNFTRDESCGKCSPCRIGTKRMMEILDRITSGRGTMKDFDELEEIDDGPSDDELKGQDQRAWDEFQSDFFNYQKERR